MERHVITLAVVFLLVAASHATARPPAPATAPAAFDFLPASPRSPAPVVETAGDRMAKIAQENLALTKEAVAIAKSAKDSSWVGTASGALAIAVTVIGWYVLHRIHKNRVNSLRLEMTAMRAHMEAMGGQLMALQSLPLPFGIMTL